jgi:hypothetical protein
MACASHRRARRSADLFGDCDREAQRVRMIQTDAVWAIGVARCRYGSTFSHSLVWEPSCQGLAIVDALSLLRGVIRGEPAPGRFRATTLYSVRSTCSGPRP